MGLFSKVPFYIWSPWYFQLSGCPLPFPFSSRKWDFSFSVLPCISHNYLYMRHQIVRGQRERKKHWDSFCTLGTRENGPSEFGMPVHQPLLLLFLLLARDVRLGKNGKRLKIQDFLHSYPQESSFLLLWPEGGDFSWSVFCLNPMSTSLFWAAFGSKLGNTRWKG